MDGRRWANISHFQNYLKYSQEGKSLIEFEERLTLRQRYVEIFLLGLRMNKGVSLEKLDELFGQQFDQQDQKKIISYVDEGLLQKEKGSLKASDKGRLVLDEIALQFI